jgi:hypothetical protein
MSIRPVVRRRLRSWLLLLSSFCLLLGFTGRSAFATVTDCVGDAPDGRFICKNPTGPTAKNTGAVHNQGR